MENEGKGLGYECVIFYINFDLDMNMIIQNIKVAWRNLMKYKLQTAINVLSIAVGIVTLSLTQSVLRSFRLPVISGESYFERAYEVSFKQISDKDAGDVKVPHDLLRSLKENGVLKSAEMVTAPNGFRVAILADFHLADSTIRKGFISGCPIDADYASYAGYRSAITGKKIRSLKSGEGIISSKFAESKFPDRNPIGAVQLVTSIGQPIPVTIVDVYESLPYSDAYYDANILLYCIGEDIEVYDSDDYFYAKWINVVLKDGYSPQQLQLEIDHIATPMGLKSKLSKVADREEFSFLSKIHIMITIVGALILLAAVIGFMRIEIQLIAIRRRELTLRVVNGATRRNLLGQIFLEILIPIVSAVSLALLLGILLEDFMNMNLIELFSERAFEIKGLWRYSLLTGAALTSICTLIVWVSLIRFRNTGIGLAVNLRRSRNHLFRNIMLGLQIAISMVFVCSTFLIINAGNWILKASNVPDKDSNYKEWLSLKPGDVSQPERLVEEISRLGNLDRIVLWGNEYLRVMEVGESSEAMERLDGRQWFRTFCANDTTVISLMDIDVTWLNRNVDRSDCILIGEDLYVTFKELGLLKNGSLRLDIRFDVKVTLPIAGIIRSIPYETDKKSLIAIHPVWETTVAQYLIIPRTGKGRALFSDVNATIRDLEPQVMDTILFYYRDEMNNMPGLVETIRTGGWILSLVSLLICAMSIFSSIALDTRSRKKEIAIRKVNGAKSYDIYRMFGRVYVWLIIASLVISIPVCIIFNDLLKRIMQDNVPNAVLSPLWAIVLGCLTVITLIFTIVFWQINSVMRVNPAKIIAKE